MSNFPTYERIAWFDQRTRDRKYPNASTLAARFEISNKTALRTLEFMRDRLGAPLEYDPVKKGYFYSDQSFSLPPLQAGQEELLALIIARNLLSGTAGGFISRSIQKLSKRLIRESLAQGLAEPVLDELFSATWTQYAPAPDESFKRCMNALLKHQHLAFNYSSPGSEAESSRKVAPHHLQHYMGSWVLIAWCTSRKGWRKFYLSRMNNLQVEKDTFTPRSFKEWKFLIDSSFGIFQNETVTLVTLRFSPFRAGWIREQIWHPAQTLKVAPDGGIELSVPVSDFREIKMKILQFGADVEVVAPESLRKEVDEEINKMKALYSKNIF